MILPHLDGAYNLARHLTHDAPLSEDVVQDAFERAFKAFPQFRGGSARAWLFAIVRNCCHTAMASQKSRKLRLVTEASLGDGELNQVENWPDEADGPEEHLSRQQEAQRIRLALEGLPEPFREAVVLREIEDLSYREIAEVAGVAIGTVMSRLARGRSMLARLLLGEDEPADLSGYKVPE